MIRRIVQNMPSPKQIRFPKLVSINSFDEANKILPAEFNDAKLAGNLLQVKLPPFSVVVLTLK